MTNRSPTPRRRFDKARAYHRRWCQRGEYGGRVIWRFILNPGGSPLRYIEHREAVHER